jgi:hypothetical protein
MSTIPNVPDTLARYIYAQLCIMLPPPHENTPEAIQLRDERAAIAVAHLLPANAAEAEVAVQIVAAQFHARDALGTAACPGLEEERIQRCRAQAARMIREANSSIRILLRMQTERAKAEEAMHPAAMERAGYWFKSITVPEHSTPDNQSSNPAPTPGGSAPRPEYGAMTPAERYATLYPDRTAQRLASGGTSTRLNFAPPDPSVVSELLSSTSPLVRALWQPRLAT